MKKILFFMIYISLDVFAEPILKLNNQDEVLSLKNYGYYFEDKNGNYTLKDILNKENQEKFQKLDQDYFSRPATKSAFWFKFDISNLTDQDVWLLVATSLAFEIDFYSPNEKGFYERPVLTGILRGEESKLYPNNWFWLPLNKAKDIKIKTFYFRITEEAPFRVGTTRSLISFKAPYDYFTAGYFGV